MRPNHIMIDYESLQQVDLQLLAPHDQFKVTVFVGAQQKRIDIKFVQALQALGMRGKYVQIDGTGPNALDFHIAFYIGRYAQVDPTTFFHVISRDHGFDPLIRHLKSLNIFCARCTSISHIPIIRNSLALTAESRAEILADDYLQRPRSRPATRRTLLSAISSLFAIKAEGGEVHAEAVVAVLIKRGLIGFEGAKVIYHFDA